jgi:sRNA-binding carbon storage regulator CsrA
MFSDRNSQGEAISFASLPDGWANGWEVLALQGSKFMLVISRKKDQLMVIDGRIHVEVVEVLQSKMIVQVRAPKSTRIEWEGGQGRRRINGRKDGHDHWFTLDPHTTLFFDREVSVTLVEVRNEKARMGFIAPKHITVQRGEVLKESDSSRED